RNDVEQDLEALRRKLRRELLETVAANRKEAAHGIGDFYAERPLGDLGRKRADAGALLVKTVGAAALDIAAADHELGLAALQESEHLRQLRLVMLQVGVHDSGKRRAGCQDALDAGAGKAAPADAADTAHARVL